MCDTVGVVPLSGPGWDSEPVGIVTVVRPFVRLKGSLESPSSILVILDSSITVGDCYTDSFFY